MRGARDFEGFLFVWGSFYSLVMWQVKYFSNVAGLDWVSYNSVTTDMSALLRRISDIWWLYKITCVSQEWCGVLREQFTQNKSRPLTAKNICENNNCFKLRTSTAVQIKQNYKLSSSQRPKLITFVISRALIQTCQHRPGTHV